MRIAVCCLLAICLLIQPQPAAADDGRFSTPERILNWMYDYRAQPDVERLPVAVHAMRKHGVFDDAERAGFFIGFIAGVLGDNGPRARALIGRMFPMPPKEQAVIVKAIAFSGLPDWRQLLAEFEPRMPERKPLIEQYVFGLEPTLMNIALEEGGTPALYALWGYYVATGFYGPVVHIISALRWHQTEIEVGGFSWDGFLTAVGWSGGEVDIDRLTLGSTARWTLVSYAERDRTLLELYREELDYQPDEVANALRDVIEAAELFEGDRVRREEAALIEEAKRRNLRQSSPGSRAANAGSIGIATACVIAGATGNFGIAVPCVVTGAVYSGVVKLLGN